MSTPTKNAKSFEQANVQKLQTYKVEVDTKEKIIYFQWKHRNHKKARIAAEYLKLSFGYTIEILDN